MGEQKLDHLSDQQLVLRLAEGNVEALGIMFDRHMASIDRFLWFTGVGPADIDDVVRRTFLQAHLTANQFDGRTSPKRWLLAIALQTARTHRRSFFGWLRWIWMWMSGTSWPFRTSAAVDRAQRKLEADCARALHSLSRDQRELFALVTVEGMSGREAATLLEVPLDTVWERLHQARIGLRPVFPVAESDQPGAQSQGVRVARSPEQRRPKQMFFISVGLAVAFALGAVTIGVGYTYSLGERAGTLRNLKQQDRDCEFFEGSLSMAGIPWKFSVADKEIAGQLDGLVGQRVALRYQQRKRVVPVCSGQTEYLITAVRQLE